MTPLAPFLLLAAAPAAEPTDAEARRTARDMLEQFLAEDEHLSLFRSYDGNDGVIIAPRGRASNRDGMCERDVITIQRAAADRLPTPGSSAIREVKAEKWFYVVTDESDQPLWTLRGNDLERRCAAVPANQSRWFSADDVDSALSAVHGLFALKTELLKPSSERVEKECGLIGRCPESASLAERIDPLRPIGAWKFRLNCPQDRWCVDVLLDNVGCGAWSTQLRMESTDITSFRSARIGHFVGGLHCGEMEVEREMEQQMKRNGD
jgi:hypothetical protein